MNDRRQRDRRKKEGTIVIAPRREKERRAAERRDGDRVAVDVWLEEEHEDEVSYRQAGDLSPGGIRLERGFSHPIGTVVKLRFALPGDDTPLEVEAEVVAVKPDENRLQSSMKFVDISEETRRRIRDFVAQAQPKEDASEE